VVEEAPHRFGHVALTGRPNVGKSTLLNAAIAMPLSIVTPKPQTTRHRILGILSRSDAQVVFIDTPGLHLDARRAINRRLNRTARQAPEEADVLVHVVEAMRWNAEDEEAWRVIGGASKPRLLAVNKVDRVRDKTTLPVFASKILAEHDYAAVHYLDARRGKGVEALLDDVVGRLPPGEAAYDSDDFTDRSERFLVAELIREQLMLRLSAELPYAAAVEIERFVEEGALTRIGAVIWVERDSQKAIVIGAGGATLKAIGSAARRGIERLLGRRVFLELWVRVRDNWGDDDSAVARLGYSE
jgi:GTP-binding protein Era